MAKWDFCGYATKNDIQCADGRIIRRNAFVGNDGAKVPIVWNHQHNDIDKVLGHGILENRPDGVFVYGSFNDTEAGKKAKKAVLHGDIESLSIYANQLKQRGCEVLHGCIREVSLVLAGANPGAQITDVSVAHSADAEYDAWIFSGDPIEIQHSDEDMSNNEEGEYIMHDNMEEVIDSMTEEQMDAMRYMVGQALAHSAEEDYEDDEEYDDDEDYEDEYEDDDDYEDDDEEDYDDEDDEEYFEHSAEEDPDATVQDVIDTMTETQKKVMYAMVGQALAANSDEDDEDEEGESDMKHNVFDNEYEDDVMMHSMDDINDAIADAQKYGSMRDAFLAHGIDDLRVPGESDYGIKGIDALFPDARLLSNTPEFIKRPTEWVSTVMGSVKHTPFSRVKSIFADITADEARAKGYTKGKRKVEEVISLLKRTTVATTVYKKQKIDRDDVIDITEFEMIPWLKAEMRGMLDEEIARAILIGDGRTPGIDDKIDEQCIRPIWTDNDLFTVKADIKVTAATTENELAKEIIRTSIKTRKDYKGSGNPVFFTTEDVLADLLLIEDVNGRFIYADEQAVAKAMRCSKIVTVPVMAGAKTADNKELLGIIVNLTDYNVGADKGGSVSMFDDFDIDYNRMKYLIETRCSGALVKPFSAIAIHKVLGE